MPRSLAALPLVVLMALMAGPASVAETRVAPSIALHGEPKYGPDIDHFDFANPHAPKGGDVKVSAIGTFDTLNPYTLKGVSAAGLGLIYDQLTYNSPDEAFTEYGLIAETIEVPSDHSWVTFTLRPEARFHDGEAIEVEDVIFTLETLKTQGHPFYRAYYANVATAEQVGERAVKFTFSGDVNRELPLIVGQMPVLPKHYWEGREFDKTVLDPPPGSGPYRVKSLEPGRSITYERVEDYWAKDLPMHRGEYNFDTIRYDYYRDATVALEAFKAGEYDFRSENTSKSWATGYDGPALSAGLIKKEEIANERPTGMQGFVFNTRRPMFRDSRVRQALAHAFDFEWTNKTLFYDAYARTESYFSNSELASQGLPMDAELEILEPYRGRIPEAVFTTEYKAPATDGSGNIRRNLRTALKLLGEAGWEVKDGKLTELATGQVMAFELLLVQPTFERIALPLKKNLERLGVDMKVRTVDTAQYQKRLDDFDFDMTVISIGQSLSPGNEQRDFWTSAKADEPGSRNLAGIRDPVVDELVELVIAAPDRESLIARTRALDRVLLWGHYVIPNWHTRTFRVAYWDKFGRPAETPRYALGFNNWWVDPDKAAALKAKRKSRQD
jgi:microcin C transport system substrate-binding protein